MKNVSVDVNDEIYDEVATILEEWDMDMEIAIKMFFKRIMRERCVEHIFPKMKNSTPPPSIASNRTEQESEKKQSAMRKGDAIKYFQAKGERMGSIVTFASKNKSTHNYWANPSFSVLHEDWTLLLNDWINRKLYLFFIPKNAIAASMLVPRNDQKHLIDLQILEDSPIFEDKKSRMSFKPYLRGELDY